MNYSLSFNQKINTILFVLFSILFIANVNHLSQQGIYTHSYVPLADSLLNGSYKLRNEFFDTYPMWGYPIVLSILKYIGLDYNNILIIQYFFLIISFKIITKSIKYNKNNFFKLLILFFLFIYYVAILSVKWPDAFLAFFLLLVAHFHIKKEYFKAAIILALAYNFRTEAILFLFVYLIIMYYISRQKKIFFSLFLIAPYILTNIYIHKTLIPTTTNSGGVLYITLGQLPNNKWNRIHSDDEAYKYVQKESNNQIVNPWGIEGNKYLKDAFLNDINSYPFEYIKKSLYNLYSVLKGGLYSFEYSMIFLDKETYKKNINIYKSHLQIIKNNP